MAWLERVQAGGRGLERRLDSVPAEALLAGLRAAGAVTEPEVAALGRPGSSGWVRRLCALAVARGDQTCRVLLTVLEGLEGPPRPGPFDFYDPQRDAAPTHRSDCPCCQPEPQGACEEEEEEGQPRSGEEGPKEEEGEAQNGEEGLEDDKGGGDEGPEGEGDEGPEEDEGPKDNEGEGDEGPEDDEGGGVEGPEDDEDGGDEDLEEDEGGGDEGPEDEDGGDEGPEEDEGGGDED